MDEAREAKEREGQEEQPGESREGAPEGIDVRSREP